MRSVTYIISPRKDGGWGLEGAGLNLWYECGADATSYALHNSRDKPVMLMGITREGEIKVRSLEAEEEASHYLYGGRRTL